jgi:adenylate kinase family enzyme
MGAVQIAGCSGAGKTAIAAVLARRGLAAIDADGDPLLARTVDAAGNVVEEAEEPEEPDFAWLSRHGWAWNPARLDELIRAAAPATLYVCGGADNQLELADRCTVVFLLEIDEPTMLARLDARRDYHDWGRIGDTREYLRRKLPELQDRLRAAGAIPIDARQPLDQVVDAILSRTLASSAAGRGQQAEQSTGQSRLTVGTRVSLARHRRLAARDLRRTTPAGIRRPERA